MIGAYFDTRRALSLFRKLFFESSFYFTCLNSSIGSGWLAVPQLAGVVLNKSSLPLFRFASAASRESSVQAANKQKQSDAYRAAVLSVRTTRGLG